VRRPEPARASGALVVASVACLAALVAGAVLGTPHELEPVAVPLELDACEPELEGEAEAFDNPAPPPGDPRD